MKQKLAILTAAALMPLGAGCGALPDGLVDSARTGAEQAIEQAVEEVLAQSLEVAIDELIGTTLPFLDAE